MRVMNLRYSNKKKVRGVRRNSISMVKRIESITQGFPEVDLVYGYSHLHLPLAQTFIDSSNTPSFVRRLCIQTLINRVKYLIEIKPKLDINSRVVTVVSLPNIWDSQIIVFFGDDYFGSFFDRDNDYQRWTRLPTNRDIAKEWNLEIPEGLSVKGYLEEINDEDYQYKCELWHFGELE